MLQRIIAAVLLVAGLVAVGLGVASATVWRDSDTVTATTAFTGDGTMLVTEPGVLDLVDADVTIRATAPGEQEVTLAIGREVDVTGWVGQDPHGAVTGLADWDRLATTQVTPEEAAEDEAPAEGTETPAEETEAPADTEETAAVGIDPAGSDMWVAEASGAGSVSLRWSDQPGRWQLLAAGVGEGAAAPTLELSWPREVETPYLWPGVIGGIVLILLGLGIGAASLRPGRRKTSGRRGETGATPVVAPAGGGDAERARTASGTPDRAEEPPADTAEVRTLTRRQLREREEAERLAAQPGRPQKPRRAWLTGQIPVVPRDKRPKTAAQPVVDPTTAHPTEQDSATTRADAWRRAWGFSAGTSESGTPRDETDETKDSTR
ncbi:hypothetical protein [Cellulosimicrobium cellulans]|uniref:hypothetical protein n=1 Tax=Cellulosimicrobium cellulans TaxID=1710 RepID=UPI00084904F9|nr:hypothetical protein [Cellulosimicrobium cellulans]